MTFLLDLLAPALLGDLHAAASAPPARPLIDLGKVFTLFFVMLGPLRLLPVFAAIGAQSDPPGRLEMALRSTGLAAATLIGGGLLGCQLLVSWGISVPVLLLSGGGIFLIVALQSLLAQYDAASSTRAPALAAPDRTGASVIGSAFARRDAPGDDVRPAAVEPSPRAFPSVVTPYGIAAVIVLLASSSGVSRTLGVIAMLALVLLLDLLGMLYAHRVVRQRTRNAPTILASIVAVLQVALAVQIIVAAMTELAASHGAQNA